MTDTPTPPPPPTPRPGKAGKARVIVSIVAIAVIAAVAFGGAKLLVALKPAPESVAPPHPGPRVEVIVAEPTRASATIHRHGEVEPRTRIDLVPQVSGTVLAVHPQLIDGGYFAAGDVLVKLDPRDYELALRRAEASLQQADGVVELRRADIASAQSRLDQEQAEATVRRAEWDRERPGVAPPPLVARVPQVNAAKAALASAEAQLASAQAEVAAAQAAVDRAKLDLERTTLAAPFTGRVLSENVDAGQFVPAGAPLASIYATDVAEIVVPVESRQLRWFDIPDGVDPPVAHAGPGSADRPGAPVVIEAVAMGVPRRWLGRAVRTTGQIDPRSRMVHVVIEVANPQATDGGAALVPGMFVDVAIEGRTLDGVYRIPRHAIHRHETTLDTSVWLAVDGQLVAQPVTVARYQQDEAWVTAGLGGGERIVVTPLEAPVPGMAVRIVDGDTAEPAAAPTADANNTETDGTAGTGAP